MGIEATSQPLIPGSLMALSRTLVSRVQCGHGCIYLLILILSRSWAVIVGWCSNASNDRHKGISPSMLLQVGPGCWWLFFSLSLLLRKVKWNFFLSEWNGERQFAIARRWQYQAFAGRVYTCKLHAWCWAQNFEFDLLALNGCSKWGDYF